MEDCLKNICANHDIPAECVEKTAAFFAEGINTQNMLMAAAYIQKAQNSPVMKLPVYLCTEAQATGAKILRGSGGFFYADYTFNLPEQLKSIPPIDLGKPVQMVLDSIRQAQSPVMLQVMAPYSVLASVIEPACFYRWLRKNADGVKEALDKITEGLAQYIRSAVEAGAKIISVADPNAEKALIGEEKYVEFSASYLAGLLHKLAGLPAVIHICPKSSWDLEYYGFLHSYEIKTDPVNQINALLLLGNALAGHQCIHQHMIHHLNILTLTGKT